jgi:4-hydroxy-3-polyprenylbenzoate decarboxylase
MQPPSGLIEKVRGLQKLKSVADSRPKTVGKGVCQEIVLRGDDVDLGLLPIQRCWPGDPAPFITLPAVITHDPQTRGRNLGMYRMQVIDRNTTFMHWQIHKDGRADYLATDGRIEVAVALGLDPITAYSASAPLPKHIDELMMAGFLRGEPVELVKGVTVGIEVPARAEIVLEGYIEKDEVGQEGPFGDHTGYYTAAEPFPVSNTSEQFRSRAGLEG